MKKQVLMTRRNIHMSKSQWAGLCAMAKRCGMSTADLIRRCLADHASKTGKKYAIKKKGKA